MQVAKQNPNQPIIIDNQPQANFKIYLKGHPLLLIKKERKTPPTQTFKVGIGRIISS